MQKITYQGQVIDFNLLAIGTEELREIKRKTGMTVAKFLQGITEVDVDAMAALRWLVLRAGGQQDLVLLARDPFPDYWDFVKAWNDSEDDTEKEEPDPTLAGSLPATSTPSSTGSSEWTSRTSSPSTGSPLPGSSEYANGNSDGSPMPLSSPTALA